MPRSEAERKRGSRKAVLFTEELQTFLSGQTYQFGSETRLSLIHISGVVIQIFGQFSLFCTYRFKKVLVTTIE